MASGVADTEAESKDEAHARREQYSRELLADILKAKSRKPKVFGEVSIKLRYEAGILKEVAVTDTATYR